MVAGEVVAQQDAGDLLGEVGGSILRVDEITNDTGDCLSVRVRAHNGDLRTRPVEGPGSDGMTLCGVGVEQIIGSPTLDCCGKFPAQIHGVAEPGVESLAS